MGNASTSGGSSGSSQQRSDQSEAEVHMLARLKSLAVEVPDRQQACRDPLFSHVLTLEIASGTNSQAFKF
jgi:hypothetical protein